MRTRTLVVMAAIGAAGIVSSLAQTVYSVNAVGFVNLSLPTGFSLIANPLNASTNNNINNVLPDNVTTPPVPDNTTIQTWDSRPLGEGGQGFRQLATYYAGAGWLDETLNNPSPIVLAPGSGAFINMAAPGTVTFVGEVPQGNLSAPIPVAFSLMSQLTPQELDLVSSGLAGGDNDTVQFYNNTVPQAQRSFVNLCTSYGGSWYDSTLNPTTVTPKIGEAFFYNRDPGNGTNTWTRTFNVSP